MFGGKRMDTFMDKLAHKLTAQEMIKANSAADAEEMKKLKNQVKEYRDVLDQMQTQVTESIEKLNQVQMEAKDNSELLEAVAQLKQSVEMKINGMQEDWNELEQAVNSKLNYTNESVSRLEGVLDEKVGSAIGTKLDNVNENIHKECVKVYRNVQAAVVEENNKQTENIVEAVNSLKGKLGAILGVSIVALIAALGGIAFQVLVYLQII